MPPSLPIKWPLFAALSWMVGCGSPVPAPSTHCAPSEVPNSDHSSPGSLDGSLGQPFLVLCEEGFEGGGVTYCQDDTTYLEVACTPHDDCAQPAGTEQHLGRFKGPVDVFLGDSVGPISLMVAFEGGTHYQDGRCVGDVYREVAQLLQRLFLDMAERGLAHSELHRLRDGLSGHEEAGLAIDDTESACGYSIIEGVGGRLGCGPGVDEEGRLDLAHEINHIWKWARVREDAEEHLVWWKTFVAFANRYHQIAATDPAGLAAVPWDMGDYDYTLENAEEWGAELFRHWLYGPGGWSVGGIVMDREMPDFVAYVTCLWKEGEPIQACADQHLTAVLPLDPSLSPSALGAVLDDLSSEETDAVWRVCGGDGASSEDLAILDALSSEVAPQLPAGPSSHYELGVGDCDHDGALDWLCWYDGPGPTGVGNESYTGNPANTEGTFTFVRGGQPDSELNFILPDPYVTHDALPQPGLVQPWSRTWPGPSGACNGAVLLSSHPGWAELLAGKN